MEQTTKQKIGRLGEDIAVKHLQNKGFSIICLNYLKKCGEIDIIAQKGKKVHFIEVKSVSHETTDDFSRNASGKVTCETDNYRAEDNIHEYKLKRLMRTIQLYLLESFPKGEPEWQLDAIVVRLEINTKKASVKFIENIGI